MTHDHDGVVQTTTAPAAARRHPRRHRRPRARRRLWFFAFGPGQGTFGGEHRTAPTSTSTSSSRRSRRPPADRRRRARRPGTAAGTSAHGVTPARPVRLRGAHCAHRLGGERHEHATARPRRRRRAADHRHSPSIALSEEGFRVVTAQRRRGRARQGRGGPPRHRPARHRHAGPRRDRGHAAAPRAAPGPGDPAHRRRARPPTRRRASTSAPTTTSPSRSTPTSSPRASRAIRRSLGAQPGAGVIRVRRRRDRPRAPDGHPRRRARPALAHRVAAAQHLAANAGKVVLHRSC